MFSRNSPHIYFILKLHEFFLKSATSSKIFTNFMKLYRIKNRLYYMNYMIERVFLLYIYFFPFLYAVMKHLTSSKSYSFFVIVVVEITNIQETRLQLRKNIY